MHSVYNEILLERILSLLLWIIVLVFILFVCTGNCGNNCKEELTTNPTFPQIFYQPVGQDIPCNKDAISLIVNIIPGNILFGPIFEFLSFHDFTNLWKCYDFTAPQIEYGFKKFQTRTYGEHIYTEYFPNQEDGTFLLLKSIKQILTVTNPKFPIRFSETGLILYTYGRLELKGFKFETIIEPYFLENVESFSVINSIDNMKMIISISYFGNQIKTQSLIAEKRIEHPWYIKLA